MNHVLCTCSNIVFFKLEFMLSLHFEYVRVFSKESKQLRSVFQRFYSS